MMPARTMFTLVSLLLLTALVVAPDLEAHEPGATPKVQGEHVATTPLEGSPDKEIDIQIYTFPPETAVPWHIHKDAVEIDYAIQGSIMLEEKGKPPYEIAEGETNVLEPNVVHRGWNPSKTKPAVLYVVRIKPKGAPLATIVPPPAKKADAPEAADYPEDDKSGGAR